MATIHRPAFFAAVIASILFATAYLFGNDPDTGTASPDLSGPADCPETGDVCADGTIYAGNNFAATPADASGFYIWADGQRYCEDLVANGHNDWTLPTEDQLNQLYNNRNTGGFAGTFNENSSLASWYWSSEEHPAVSSHARGQRFTVGDDYELLEPESSRKGNSDREGLATVSRQLKVVFDTNIYVSAFLLPGGQADSAPMRIATKPIG